MIRVTTVLAATGASIFAIPASAQDHSMHDIPGMSMPAAKPAAKPAPKPRRPAARLVAPAQAPRRAPTKPKQPAAPAQGMRGMEGMDHSQMPGMSMPSAADKKGSAMPEMDHGAMPGMDHGGARGPATAGEHAGHDMSGMTATQPAGTALSAGDAPAPKPPMDHYADRQFPPHEMAQARQQMMREEGGQTFHQIMFNLAEYRVRQGRDGYRWDGEAWFGGDINRLTVKSEGEGIFRQGVEAVEVQVLYSRAVGPYFNLQAGVRHDIRPSPSRTYAVVGFEGLAPYWFEVEGALFLSDKGDLLGRLEGYYDQRLTQRLVLQPRIELNFAAQDVPETRTGAGLSDAELGLRLRYEISRQLAPYLGVNYEAKTGQTARYARADGEDPTSTSFVAGVRVWF